jgi:formate dehydrogenase major subunit
LRLSERTRGNRLAMPLTERLAGWPVLRQLRGDPLALGSAARSERSARLAPRTSRAEHVVGSICPYCAVGCGQLVYVEGGEVTQIEGDPGSPVSRGRLCPKGSASKSLVTSLRRVQRVRYRPPYATEWQDLSLDDAMEMIADRVLATRAETWEEAVPGGDEGTLRVNRTLGIASLGGATLDNEENYLLKKLFTALGVVQVENQARI